ncbi:hypothetical protein SAMN04487988_101265 [Algoriphagus hitonicola]|uniref:NVEALA protein n=1 Tax=Algoriphagus hitonicola TaxID=435880 RepID=A0A1I2NQM0_9BACT|nr:hypothetical protein SAMN04487988_101265 [Algoriphagus hitonicola]
MKKIKIFLSITIVMVFCFQISLFADCGLPPSEGCELVSGGGPCSGDPDASVYDCNGNIQVYSTLLPSGGCAGSHSDCMSAPTFG